MSKRFGRNQKRRLKAETRSARENLMRADINAVRWQREMGDSLRRYEQMLEVIYNVCPHSVALSDAVKRTRDRGTWQLDTASINVSQFVVGDAQVMPEFITHEFIDLYQLEVELRDSPEFRNAIGIQVKLADQSGRSLSVAGYRASAEGFRANPTRTVAEISKQLGDLIAKDLNKGRR